MAVNNPAHNSTHPNNIYTVYQGEGNNNYGFYPGHPQAPPPKYEDVMSGRPGDQHRHLPPPPPSGPYQHEVILVTPEYNYSRTHRLIGLLFTIIFLIAIISIFVKIMSSR